MCEETEKMFGWGTTKNSGVRILRGCKVSMREPRSVGDAVGEEVAGKGETSTRSERRRWWVRAMVREIGNRGNRKQKEIEK